MRALIVEDDFYCRTMLHDMLKPLADCDIAVNGEEAIFAFRTAHRSGNPYDLVLMDIVMPEMDGHQALREIRAIEKELDVDPVNEVKIVVTTVLDDQKETHDAFFLGGATSYLVKPLEEEALLRELTSLGLIAGTPGG